MKKVSKEFFLIILVVFLLILSIGFKLRLNKYTGASDITGKYEPLPGENYKGQVVDIWNEYIIFENNTFKRYSNSKLVESGTYEQFHDCVYIIKSKNFDDLVYYANDSFYLYFNEDKGHEYIVKYVKVKK